MTALGVVEVIGADTSFASDSARPVVPGIGRVTVGSHPTRTPPRGTSDAVADLISANTDRTLRAARAQAERLPSATTVASLALALELAGDQEQAVNAARRALNLATAASGNLIDPTAARIGLQILMRSGETDDAVRIASSLPLDGHLSLEIGAAAGSQGRLRDAWLFVEGGKGAPSHDAVAGYLHALGGDYRAAVPPLRAALQATPRDADSAFNLSIALWHLGAIRKAIAAAMQARASAPAREDIGLHLFELLLHDGAAARVDREIHRLVSQGVIPSARLLVLQARSKLMLKEPDSAVRLLERASVLARESGDLGTFAEVQSNLLRIRVLRGRTARKDAISRLLALHKEIPDQPIVVVNLAQVMNRRSHTAVLRSAVADVRPSATESQLAFLDYQIATLDGDAAAATEFACEWLRLEPANPRALAAAMVALGIGEERWHEAADLAITLRSSAKFDLGEVNNAAYVLAMAGMSELAIGLLEPIASQSFVLRATLGLAHLAAGQIDVGMRHYRRAADEAEKLKDDSRSLMTAYQALVVRQLGLLDSADRAKVTAISLPPYPLPEDWEDRPEFIRLLGVARRHGYAWPLEL